MENKINKRCPKKVIEIWCLDVACRAFDFKKTVFTVNFL